VLEEIELQLRSGKLVWEDTFQKVKKQKKALADASKPK
jgi:hypothetical protein